MYRRLVVIESPYAGDVLGNVEYARACMADSIKRGEAPIASHLLYTQPGILRDEVPEERLIGMAAGRAWHLAADLVVFYTDLGWSSGMKQALQHAKDHDIPITERKLENWDRQTPGFSNESFDIQKWGP